MQISPATSNIANENEIESKLYFTWTTWSPFAEREEDWPPGIHQSSSHHRISAQEESKMSITKHYLPSSNRFLLPQSWPCSVIVAVVILEIIYSLQPKQDSRPWNLCLNRTKCETESIITHEAKVLASISSCPSEPGCFLLQVKKLQQNQPHSSSVTGIYICSNNASVTAKYPASEYIPNLSPLLWT